MSGPIIQRTALELYRDCLRLIHHIAPGNTSPKSQSLRTMLRTEYDKSRAETDPAKIDLLKGNAVRALSNYMLYEGGIKDRGQGGKLGMAMERYHKSSVKGMARGGNGSGGRVDGVPSATAESLTSPDKGGESR